jgi:hypothetical protein
LLKNKELRNKLNNYKFNRHNLNNKDNNPWIIYKALALPKISGPNLKKDKFHRLKEF